MEKFKQLGLKEEMLHVIRDLGFKEPSEIQVKTIPLVIAGKDVIGNSATGSGKTLAFGAGIIERMKREPGIQTLIMTPTRELAEQVAGNMRTFSRHYGFNVTEIYGGVSIGPQFNSLRRANIVVGTPGRILDHLERRTLSLARVKFLVLDEADRMLDMGFIRDVEKILKHCPADRQTLLFSATISNEINHIAQRHMRSPVTISVDNQVDPSQLYQKYYDVPAELKFSLLVHLLKLEKEGVVMIFCNTRRNVDKLYRYLYQENIHALPIHGGLSQNRRNDTLRAFHSRDTMILVCTDIAARGLDIKDVSHIYNFDIPSTANEYIHRIGRTARAGKDGIAISFVSPGDHSEFRQILREKNLEIEKDNLPDNLKNLSISFSSNSDRKEARKGNRGRGFRGRSNRDRSRGNRGGGNGEENGRRDSRGRNSRGRSAGRGNRPRFNRFNRRF